MVSNAATQPLRAAIRKKLKSLNYEQIKHTDDIFKKKSFQDKVYFYCRNMERFAVGIEIGVYDFDTFEKLSGETTMRLFNQIKPLIEHRRSYFDQSYCMEFEHLCQRLMKRTPIGKMLHS